MSKRRKPIRQELQAFYEATSDVRFSDAIAALDYHYIEKRGRGAPKKWHRSDLIRLWASVQAFTFDGKKSASDACRFLVKGEGWGYFESKAGVEKRAVIKNNRSLNRLYNDADKFVSSNPDAAKEAGRQMRRFIFERDPGNRLIGEQVKQDNIEMNKELRKFFKSVNETRAKNKP